LKRPIEPIVTWPQPAAAGYTSGSEKLFDITIVVGSVYADSTSNRSPFQVAMATIAEYAENAPNPEPVTYSFPNLDGEPITVTIHNPSSIHHRE
jgi:hypothetical protein